MPDAGTYSIIYKGNELRPIIKAGKLRSDMLMVIRIPNPWHPTDGCIMVMGGMHGYSLKAFFRTKDVLSHVTRLHALCEKFSCFQALVSAELDDRGEATLLWEDKRDWSEWRSHV